MSISIKEARARIKQGEVIAYPTEAVYGLGCDPFNKAAVHQILALKQRPEAKGLILLIANYEQLWPLIATIPDENLEAVKKSWPGFVTWIFPKSDLVPSWVSGEHDGIAIRMSAHPVAHALCQDAPIISTSANIAGESPAKSITELQHSFFEALSIVTGELGGNDQVSEIYDALSAVKLR